MYVLKPDHAVWRGGAGCTVLQPNVSIKKEPAVHPRPQSGFWSPALQHASVAKVASIVELQLRMSLHLPDSGAWASHAMPYHQGWLAAASPLAAADRMGTAIATLVLLLPACIHC